MGLLSWKVPEDFDFSSWHGSLSNEINGCGKKFDLSDLHYGRSLLSALRSDSAASRLAKYLNGDKSLSSYLNSRWWIIPALVITGVVFLVCGLYFAFCIYKVRPFCCCKNPHRDEAKRSRLTKRGGGYRLFWKLTVAILSLGLIVLASLGIVGGAQEIQALDRTKCNGWLTFYTYFFGVQDIDTSKFERITTKWNGTQPLKDSLAQVRAKAQPAALFEEAETRRTQAFQEAYDAYYDFRNVTMAGHLLATEQEKLLNCVLTNALNTTDTVYGDYLRTPSLVGSRMKGVWLREQFLGVLQATEARLAEVFETFFGANSALAGGITNAIDMASAYLLEIDAAVGYMVQKWQSFTKHITDYAKATAILTFIFAPVVIIAGCFAFYCFLRLPKNVDRAFETYHKVPRKFRVTACLLAVVTGLAALLAATHYGIAAVGSDICAVGRDNFLEQEDWSLLGEKVHYPLGNGTHVDIDSTLLKQCLGKGGSGALLEGIGFATSLQNEVAEELRVLETTVSELTGTVIMRGARESSASLLARMYRTALTNRFHMRPPLTGTEDDAVFNRVEELGHFHFDNGGDLVIFYPFANIHLDQGPSFILLPTNGGWITVTSQGNGVDWYNAFAQHLSENVDDAYIPAFCGDLAISSGSSCTRDSAASLPDLTDKEIDNLVLQIPEDYTYRDETSVLRERVAHTLRYLRDNELMALFVPTEAGCGANWPDGRITTCVTAEGLPCQYRAWYAQEQARFRQYADYVQRAIHLSFGRLESLVTSELISIVDDLADAAGALGDDANCQLLRETIEEALVPELCDFLFPGTAFVALMWLLIFLVALVLFILFTLLVRRLDRNIRNHEDWKKTDGEEAAARDAKAAREDEESTDDSEVASSRRVLPRTVQAAAPPPQTLARGISGLSTSSADYSAETTLSRNSAAPALHLPQAAMFRSPDGAISPRGVSSSTELDLGPYALQSPTSVGTDRRLHIINTPKHSPLIDETTAAPSSDRSPQ